eukprot:5923287-Prymnesium_polylepis.1
MVPTPLYRDKAYDIDQQRRNVRLPRVIKGIGKGHKFPVVNYFDMWMGYCPTWPIKQKSAVLYYEGGKGSYNDSTCMHNGNKMMGSDGEHPVKE